VGPRAEAVLHWFMLNPEGKVRDCARALGLRPGWVAQLVGSDWFKAQLSARTKELGAESVLGLKARLEALRVLAAERLEEKLEADEVSERGLLELVKAQTGEAQQPQPHLHVHVSGAELMEARRLAEELRQSVPRKDERLIPAAIPIGPGEGVRD